MDREYIPVLELIPVNYHNHSITTDKIFNFLCEHKDKIQLYLLPQGLVCWKYIRNNDIDSTCKHIQSDKKCYCKNVERLESNYYNLCTQYHKRLQANDEVVVQYLCKNSPYNKGLFLDGNYSDGYTRKSITINKKSVYLKSNDFNELKYYFLINYALPNKSDTNHLEIHPILKDKYKSKETQDEHQLMWNKAEEIRKSFPNLSLLAIADKIEKNSAVNFNNRTTESIRKFIENNPAL